MNANWVLISACVAILPLLGAPTAFAWSRHDLLTRHALHGAIPGVGDLDDESVAPETLESFVEKEKHSLSAFFDGYYAYTSFLAKYGYSSARLRPVRFDSRAGGVDGFLRAAKLNPRISFSVETGPVSALAVLEKYADEPDHGMDQELWGIREYEFEEPPYGAKTGFSSQAPFHMRFFHESPIMRIAEPEIASGLAYDRLALFVQLARFARSRGHTYWAYRFTSWALHYLQDIGQPYHASALPFANLRFYLKFLLAEDKGRMAAEATRIATNRHYAYEDFTAEYLRTADAVKALSEGIGAFAGMNEYTLFVQLEFEAAAHAERLDRAVVMAFGESLMNDPHYDYDTEVKRRGKPRGDVLNPNGLNTLEQETRYLFERVGAASRALVQLLRKS